MTAPTRRRRKLKLVGSFKLLDRKGEEGHRRLQSSVQDKAALIVNRAVQRARYATSHPEGEKR